MIKSYSGFCYGTCGEILQGIYQKKECIVSYRINKGSKITLKKRNELKNFKAPKKIFLAFKYLFEAYNENLNILDDFELIVNRSLPVGKGMSSSSSDIFAALKVGSKILKKEVDENLFLKIASKIDPTDYVISKNQAIFDPKNAKIIKTLGVLKNLKVVVLEPENRINTIELKKNENYYKTRYKFEKEYQKLFLKLINAYENNDINMIAKIATISSFLNQEIHKKIYLEEILEIGLKNDALGLNIAHSGTVIALLMEKSKDHEKLIFNLKSEKNILNVYKKVYNLDII